jgi:hypothetical protein
MNKQLIKIKYIKKQILSKNYREYRADVMNDKVHYWIDSYNHATMERTRQFCNTMIDMYLKRYGYYCKTR